VAPAVIGRRIDALEARLGVKLMVRTTRRITLTHEGSRVFSKTASACSRIGPLAEASVSAGGSQGERLSADHVAGRLRRRHVAPLVPRFLALHPEVNISLNLSDRVVDIVNESFDCAVRVGDLPDSSLVSVRLADNRRLCVATPALPQARRHAAAPERAGPPRMPDPEQRRQPDTRLGVHRRRRGDPPAAERPARLHRRPGAARMVPRRTRHAWRSTWEVEHEVASGQLVSVLDELPRRRTASTRCSRTRSTWR